MIQRGRGKRMRGREDNIAQRGRGIAQRGERTRSLRGERGQDDSEGREDRMIPRGERTG